MGATARMMNSRSLNSVGKRKRKRPKLRLPKQPKASASLRTWENWERRAKEKVQEYNRKMQPILAEDHARAVRADRVRKIKDMIVKRVSHIKHGKKVSGW